MAKKKAPESDEIDTDELTETSFDADEAEKKRVDQQMVDTAKYTKIPMEVVQRLTANHQATEAEAAKTGLATVRCKCGLFVTFSMPRQPGWPDACCSECGTKLS